MNFFNFLFNSKYKNKSISGKDIISNNQIVENSTTDNTEIIQTIKTIWDYEILFLRELHNLSICESSSLTTKYTDSQEKAEILIDNFKEIGFLKISNTYETINKRYTIPKLKEELKSRGIKSQGKKEELVNRFMSYLELDSANKNRIDKEAFYIVEPKGWNTIEESHIYRINKIASIEEYIHILLSTNKINESIDILLKIMSYAPSNLGAMVGNIESFITSEREILEYLLKSNYLNGYINLPHSEIEKIRAKIGAHYLLSHLGLKSKNIEQQLIEINPTINCKIVSDFLKKEPTGIFRYYDASSNVDLAKIISHTILFEATNTVQRINYIKKANERGIKEIVILGGSEDCSHCKGKQRSFEIKQPDKIPILPLYPGCICCYALKPNY